jgi:hypothetical protein
LTDVNQPDKLLALWEPFGDEILIGVHNNVAEGKEKINIELSGVFCYVLSDQNSQFPKVSSVSSCPLLQRSTYCSYGVAADY